MPKIEDATFDPPLVLSDGRGSRPSGSFTLLRSMKVGEVKRIVHEDLLCRVDSHPNHSNTYSCSLISCINRQHRLKSWSTDQYHEAQHILIVRRNADWKPGRGKRLKGG